MQIKLPAEFVFWAVFAATSVTLHTGAQIPGNALPPTKYFDAAPGANTLMAARDAVRAWRALGHTKELAAIRLASGEYSITEPLVLTEADGSVIWEAIDPEKTVISGGTHLTGFTPYKTGIWHAKTRLQFEQLYVNNRRAIRTRSPAEGFFQTTSVKQEELTNGKARITISVPAAIIATLPPEPAALHRVQILAVHKWDTTRYAVSAFDAVAGTITVEGTRMKPWNPWNTNSQFILEGSRLMLTQPGSWFLDETGNLSYFPRPDEQIGNSKFIAPGIEKLVEIHGASNLHFKGLRFEHAGYQLPPAGCPPVQAASMIGATIEIDLARNVSFEDVGIAHTGNYGIWFRQGCQNCRIQHSRLEDLGAGGVRVGEVKIANDPSRQTGEVIVDNNIIRGCGRVHPSAVGVWIGQSANNRVTHNDISDMYYTGISVGWTWGYGRSLATNNFIGFNRIHQIGQGVLSDMGGIYTLGVSPGSAQVGNVIFNVRAHDYGGWGIYPDEGSTGWRIESNLVWNCTCVDSCSGAAFHQHYGASNYIANNIFAFNSGSPMQATRVEKHLSFSIERNVIVSSNAAFFSASQSKGSWDKIQFESRDNCFAYFGTPRELFPNGDLTSWQKTGHEAGSILTSLQFLGNWPDVTLPPNSPAFQVSFKMFDPTVAGVYGDQAWKNNARKTEAANESGGWHL